MKKGRKLITNNQHVVLASQSLARINYLRDSGIKFEVRPHAVVESEIKKESLPFTDMVEKIAESKARSVHRNDCELLIGSDQILVCLGTVLSKPKNLDEAKKNLYYLRNRKHILISSVVAICEKKLVFKETKKATLKMKNIPNEKINQYIEKNPETALNCVGSYKIEENHIYNFLNIIKGDKDTIIGFPAKKLINRLKNE